MASLYEGPPRYRTQDTQAAPPRGVMARGPPRISSMNLQQQQQQRHYMTHQLDYQINMLKQNMEMALQSNNYGQLGEINEMMKYLQQQRHELEQIAASEREEPRWSPPSYANGTLRLEDTRLHDNNYGCAVTPSPINYNTPVSYSESCGFPPQQRSRRNSLPAAPLSPVGSYSSFAESMNLECTADEWSILFAKPVAPPQMVDVARHTYPAHTNLVNTPYPTPTTAASSVATSYAPATTVDTNVTPGTALSRHPSCFSLRELDIDRCDMNDTDDILHVDSTGGNSRGSMLPDFGDISAAPKQSTFVWNVSTESDALSQVAAAKVERPAVFHPLARRRSNSNLSDTSTPIGTPRLYSARSL